MFQLAKHWANVSGVAIIIPVETQITFFILSLQIIILIKMFSKVCKRELSTSTTNYARVIKYKGQNINVASHNEERRQAYRGDFNFKDTWGMGVEGFSHGTSLKEMNSITGNKNEYLWLFGLFVVLPFLAAGRKSNEESLSQEIKSTNKYAKLNLDAQSAALYR